MQMQWYKYRTTFEINEQIFTCSGSAFNASSIDSIASLKPLGILLVGMNFVLFWAYSHMFSSKIHALKINNPIRYLQNNRQQT